MSDETKAPLPVETPSPLSLTDEQRRFAAETYKSLEMAGAALHRLLDGPLTMILTVRLPEEEDAEDGATRPLTMGLTLCADPEAARAHTRAALEIVRRGLEKLEASPEPSVN